MGSTQLIFDYVKNYVLSFLCCLDPIALDQDKVESNTNESNVVDSANHDDVVSSHENSLNDDDDNSPAGNDNSSSAIEFDSFEQQNDSITQEVVSYSTLRNFLEYSYNLFVTHMVQVF